MFRFRPIAPKPTATVVFENKDPLLSSPRSKRPKSLELQLIRDEKSVTLQLLPEYDEKTFVMETEVSRKSQAPSSGFRLTAVVPDLTP